MYQNIIVVGCGTIAYDVLRHCHETITDCNLTYIEYAAFPFNAATIYANSRKIPCIVAKEKNDLHKYIANIGKKALIISANNTYIFPSDLTDNPNLTIINFHNALLPQYPGLNASSWVIYNQEIQTGITWHYVSSDIDAGEIIIQKKCNISEDATAGELASTLMKLGTESFKEILPGLLRGTAHSYPQEIPSKRKIFKSSDIPGDGMFDISDNAEYIYRLLRSMDYGLARVFPYPRTQYQGNKLSITDYKIIESTSDMPQEDHLLLPYGQNLFLCMKYE